MLTVCYTNFISQDKLASPFILKSRPLLFVPFQRAEEIIRAHKPSQSLFLYLAFQNVHLPVQVPKQYPDKYVGIIKDETRRNHAGMVDIMDEALGNVTEAMKEAGYEKQFVSSLSPAPGGPFLECP